MAKKVYNTVKMSDMRTAACRGYQSLESLHIGWDAGRSGCGICIGEYSKERKINR